MMCPCCNSTNILESTNSSVKIYACGDCKAFFDERLKLIESDPFESAKTIQIDISNG